MWKPLTIREVSEKIINKEDWKLWLAQFIDDFRKHPCIFNIIEPPKSELDQKYKALLQSTVLYLISEQSLEETPEWCTDLFRLSDPWFVSPMKSFIAMTLRDCPLQFKINNVFVSSDFMKRI